MQLINLLPHPTFRFAAVMQGLSFLDEVNIFPKYNAVDSILSSYKNIEKHKVIKHLFQVSLI